MPLIHLHQELLQPEAGGRGRLNSDLRSGPGAWGAGFSWGGAAPPAPLGTMSSPLVCHVGQECVCVLVENGVSQKWSCFLFRDAVCMEAGGGGRQVGVRLEWAPLRSPRWGIRSDHHRLTARIINTAGASAVSPCGNLCPVREYFGSGPYTGWTHILLAMYPVPEHTPHPWSHAFGPYDICLGYVCSVF